MHLRSTPVRRLVVVAGLIFACSAASCDRPAAPAPAACPSTPVAAGPVSAPAGGGLRVVEKGFTQLGELARTVSLGAVVENSSALVAYRVRVTLRVFDAQGQSAVAPGSGEPLDQEIPVILPGVRVGVGEWTYLREQPNGRPVTVAGFDIKLGTVQWWPPDHVFRATTAAYQGASRVPVEPEYGTVKYRVESGYCREVAARGAALLFRDADGTLVGGSFSTNGPRKRCPPGVSTDSAQAFRSMPLGIDEGRTEIYPYCDPGPVGPQPTTT